MSAPLPELDIADRWRLLLGEAGTGSLGAAGAQAFAMDRALAWLYGRDDTSGGLAPEDRLDRGGGLGASQLSVPEWINEIHTLFPKETIERLERDAIERYGIDDVVTNPEVLARATPNVALLQAVLRTKHLMNPAVLAMARELVAQVVRQLMEKMATRVEQAFNGRHQPQRTAARGPASQFAARETLRRNLRHYDAGSGRLVVREPRFRVDSRRVMMPWQVLMLVDQSGSMVPSVIHAAVTAACLCGLPGIKTHLIAFDSEVVDLTGQTGDPVGLLLNVQLGGGTCIGRAVGYAADLIEVPRRAIVVIVSDFYEGMDPQVLVGHVRALTAQGTTVLGLAALDERADPVYDRELAGRLVDAGAHVGAMTPGQLAGWLAEKLG